MNVQTIPSPLNINIKSKCYNHLILIILLNMANLNTYQFKITLLHFLLTSFPIVSPQSTGFTLKLIPWDSPKSPLYQPNLTQTQRFHRMIESSKATAIFPTLENKTFHTNEIQIPTKYQNLRYSVNIKIGKPSKEVTLLLDNGSGPIWTRCNQSSSDFNPKKSKTYKALPCQHPLCQKANNICRCIKDQCVCSLTYGIQNGIINKVEAVLSSDSFTLPMKKNKHKTFPNMIFGCSSHSPIYSGILGLDKLPVSFISQVNKSAKGRYSYCLYGGGGFLRFGKDIPRIGNDIKTTKIFYPNNRTLFLDLTDISIAHKRLGLSSALFSYKQGGFFIDTGSPLTVLKRQAYDEVIKELENYFNGRLERVNDGKYNKQLCYKYNASMRSYASMTFHLKGADYETSNLYVAPEPAITCVALIPGEVSILGAYQQWNTRFIFDINANELKFVSEDCSRDRA